MRLLCVRNVMLSNNLPKCDICQEEAAFIFCVEDRALFCKDCDEPIHSAGSQSANHQRFLATGIRVALDSGCNDNDENCLELPKPSSQTSSVKAPPQPSLSFDSSWTVDDLLQFSEFGSSDKKEQLEFGEFEWLTDMDMFAEHFGQETLAAAEVPQLRFHIKTLLHFLALISPTWDSRNKGLNELRMSTSTSLSLTWAEQDLYM